MSIKTWKAIYYPKTAKQASKNAISALDHSILKWGGLNKSVLKAHGIVQLGEELRSNSEAPFQVDDDTCALCAYDSKKCTGADSLCDHCPIKILTGLRCRAEYAEFVEDSNPKPMQRLLKKVRKQYLAEEKK